MQCQCGAMIHPREHEVTTMAGAQSWVAGAKPEDLPMRVLQWECPACGRYKHMVKTSTYDVAQGSGA